MEKTLKSIVEDQPLVKEGREMYKENIKPSSFAEMYMEEPTFVKWENEVGPNGQTIQKRVPKINLLGKEFRQIARQAGTEYGSQYLTTKEKSGKNYSTEYIQRKNANDARMKRLVQGSIDKLKAQLAKINAQVDSDTDKKIEDIIRMNSSLDKSEVDNLIQQARETGEGKKIKVSDQELKSAAIKDITDKNDSEDYGQEQMYGGAPQKTERPNPEEIEKNVALAKSRFGQNWKKDYMEEVFNNVMKRLINENKQ
jgi:hypothetical protein